jgi:chaperone modulatory protein CbpM
MSREKFELEEVCRQIGVERETVLTFIRREWIVAAPDSQGALDHEDLARIRLILELRFELGVNDEGVDIILRLLDQIHALRAGASQHSA